jgi:hypothetical protein
MNINSGYRNPIHNDALSGSATESRHQYGRAADIRVLDFNQDGNIDKTDWDILSIEAQSRGASVESFTATSHPTIWCHMEW